MSFAAFSRRPWWRDMLPTWGSRRLSWAAPGNPEPADSGDVVPDEAAFREAFDRHRHPHRQVVAAMKPALDPLTLADDPVRECER